jgi:prevent-host-death family protein
MTSGGPEKSRAATHEIRDRDHTRCFMIEYSTRDLSWKSGDIIAEALRRPVTITQRNKPRLVLLSIED